MSNPALIRALCEEANSKSDGRLWLKSLRDEARDAVLRGDQFFTSLAFEGGSGTGGREFNAQRILEATQIAIEEIDGTSTQGIILPSISQTPR